MDIANIMLELSYLVIEIFYTLRLLIVNIIVLHVLRICGIYLRFLATIQIFEDKPVEEISLICREPGKRFVPGSSIFDDVFKSSIYLLCRTKEMSLLIWE